MNQNIFSDTLQIKNDNVADYFEYEACLVEKKLLIEEEKNSLPVNNHKSISINKNYTYLNYPNINKLDQNLFHNKVDKSNGQYASELHSKSSPIKLNDSIFLKSNNSLINKFSLGNKTIFVNSHNFTISNNTNSNILKNFITNHSMTSKESQSNSKISFKNLTNQNIIHKFSNITPAIQVSNKIDHQNFTKINNHTSSVSVYNYSNILNFTQNFSVKNITNDIIKNIKENKNTTQNHDLIKLNHNGNLNKSEINKKNISNYTGSLNMYSNYSNGNSNKKNITVIPNLFVIGNKNQSEIKNMTIPFNYSLNHFITKPVKVITSNNSLEIKNVLNNTTPQIISLKNNKNELINNSTFYNNKSLYQGNTSEIHNLSNKYKNNSNQNNISEPVFKLDIQDLFTKTNFEISNSNLLKTMYYNLIPFDHINLNYSNYTKHMSTNFLLKELNISLLNRQTLNKSNITFNNFSQYLSFEKITLNFLENFTEEIKLNFNDILSNIKNLKDSQDFTSKMTKYYNVSYSILLDINSKFEKELSMLKNKTVQDVLVQMTKLKIFNYTLHIRYDNLISVLNSSRILNDLIQKFSGKIKEILSALENSSSYTNSLISNIIEDLLQGDIPEWFDTLEDIPNKKFSETSLKILSKLFKIFKKMVNAINTLNSASTQNPNQKKRFRNIMSLSSFSSSNSYQNIYSPSEKSLKETQDLIAQSLFHLTENYTNKNEYDYVLPVDRNIFEIISSDLLSQFSEITKNLEYLNNKIVKNEKEMFEKKNEKINSLKLSSQIKNNSLGFSNSSNQTKNKFDSKDEKKDIELMNRTTQSTPSSLIKNTTIEMVLPQTHVLSHTNTTNLNILIKSNSSILDDESDYESAFHIDKITISLIYNFLCVFLILIYLAIFKKILLFSISFMRNLDYDDKSNFNKAVVFLIILLSSILNFFLGKYLYNDNLISIIFSINGEFLAASIIFFNDAGVAFGYPSYLLLGTLISFNLTSHMDFIKRLIVMFIFIVVFFIIGDLLSRKQIVQLEELNEMRIPREKIDISMMGERVESHGESENIKNEDRRKSSLFNVRSPDRDMNNKNNKLHELI